MSAQPEPGSRLAKHRTVREALRYVADNPVSNHEPIDMPMWELLSRILFEIANTPNARVRGSLARATKAQKMITDRLVGTRRPGSHPSQAKRQQVRLLDLTEGVEAP